MVECPVDDWWCPYYDNGNCTFEDYKEEEEEIDKYTLDDLGNNWY